jgi:hypothetical protein
MAEVDENPEQSLHTSETVEQEKVFLAKPFIYRTDGWLNTRGIFWGCGSDEHDKCAKYIVNHSIALEDESADSADPARKVLSEHNFVQLNAGTVLPVTGIQLSEQQLKKIDEAVKKRGLDLKVALSTTRPDLENFEGLALAYKHGLLDAEQQDLVREFFENGDYFRIDDDEDVARKLYDALTLGFHEGPSFSYQGGYKRSQKYMLPKDESYALELDEHIHDGQSGLYSTSWIRVIGKEDLEKLENRYAAEQEDYWSTHNKHGRDDLNVDEVIQPIDPEEEMRRRPNLHNRIKGVSQKEMEDIGFE